MLSYEEETRQQLADLLKPYDEVAEGLLRAAEGVYTEAMETNNGPDGQRWHGCVIALLFEGTRRFRAAQLAAAAGLDREAKILVRALLELLFKAAYLCEGVDDADWPPPPAGSTARDAVAFYFLAINPHLDRERFLRDSAAFRSDHGEDDDPEDAENVAEVRASVEAARQELIADGWGAWLEMRRPSAKLYARKSGLEHYYTLIYGDSGYSADVHGASIPDAFEIDDDGETLSFRPADPRSVLRTMWLALSLLLIFAAVVAKAMSIEVHDTWRHYRQKIDGLRVPGRS